ncbi:Hypothetical_protein [Hexamita inflata]|uniref:Hypothetical_protein n=1 Tax=Hexamita inflata TaxID=28002 RepID=A0AA86P5P8_9EUKA|nr:Hypothetical protein HINF_LOCUS19550 [Hexamita inflata]
MLRLLFWSSQSYIRIVCFPLYSKNTQSTYTDQLCSNTLRNIGYCVKASSISSRVQIESISYSPASNVFFSLYTARAQDLQLNLTYKIQNLPSFALFGLTSSIILMNSNISVKIPQIISNSALICTICDLNANQTDFSFLSSGLNVSGLVLSPLNQIKLSYSLVQARLNGVNVGGMVFNASNAVLTIKECNISSYIQGQGVIGAIICQIIEGAILEVETVRMCSNIQQFGKGSVVQTGKVTETCILCRQNTYSYGLCAQSLEHGQIIEDKLVCKQSFVFDGEICSCPEGQVVNGTTCIIILETINKIIIDEMQLNGIITNLTDRNQALENSIGILKINSDNINADIQSLFSVSNHTQANLKANSTMLQQYINSNFSKANIIINNNISVLDQRIFQNTTILSNIIQTLNNSLDLKSNLSQLNQSISEQQALNSVLNQNITLLNQILASNNEIIQQQQKFISNLNLLVQCLNNVDQNNVSGSCYVVNSQNDSISCSQKVYAQQFDITAITHQVTSSNNFTGTGYVFSSSNNIQNSFIDVSDYVYSTSVSPLFQSQNTFANLKIQFGTQYLNGGSFILSQSVSIIIQDMNIISRSGTQLTVQTVSQLNILLATPTSALISNLMTNLSFAASEGNITLVGVISGTFNISGYQVLGSYVSTQTVAMIGINLSTAIVNVNQVYLRPIAFNVGNSSSYLFVDAVFSTSKLLVSNFAVIIGSSSRFQLLGSISTQSDANQFMFGGIITYVNSASTISIRNVIIDAYQHISSSYVGGSGILVAYIQQTASTVVIQNICFQQSISGVSFKFDMVGLLGFTVGRTLIQNAFVSFFIHTVELSNFGIVGFQSTFSAYAEVSNLTASVNFISSSTTGGSVGSVFGWGGAQNCYIQNTYINNSNISAGQSVSGFIGVQVQNTTVFNCSIVNINVSAFNQNANVGGLIGIGRSYLQLTQCKIQNVNVNGESGFGVVVGYSDGGIYSFISSFSASNKINGVKYRDCGTLANVWSVVGC